MTIYRHTQTGTLILSLLVPIIVLELALVLFSFHPAQAAVLAVLLVCAVLFGSLTVEVSHRFVHLRFGPGPIRRRLAVASIRGARVVRNRWFFGWGIRRIPGGWMFNVSGLDAVELDLVEGGKVRIGTDEPDALLSAIETARGHAR